MQNPTFLGIGAHKAGTSWLYSQLINHPEVYMPPKKEIHFFDRSPRYLSPNTLAESSPWIRPFKLETHDWKNIAVDTARMAKYALTGDLDRAQWYRKWLFGYYDESWYRSLFESYKGYKAYGEISPAYSMLESSDVVRIKALNPDIKLILMLRDPIDRVWSNIRYGSEKGRIKVDLDSPKDILNALKQPEVALRGDYERTLNTYLEHFDASQLLVCFYEAIKYDPIGLMSGIATFLKIAPFAKSDVDAKKRVNASKPRPMPSIVKDYLLETYGSQARRLAARLGSYANMWEGVESHTRTQLLGSSTKPDTNSSNSLQMAPTIHP
ncbi:MAG: sulfotransferase domain-containing protein [Cyanobacteria bacterium P01_D01_bin.1]